MKFIFFAILLCSFQGHAEDKARFLKTFETDGCTMFVEGPASNPKLWAHCCFEHDLRYWFGGTKDNKEFSDLELKACVKKVAGNFWANLIYNGVKAGAAVSPVKHKFSWSWGWEPERLNTRLTTAEVKYISEKLSELELDPTYKEEFIKKYLISN